MGLPSPRCGGTPLRPFHVLSYHEKVDHTPVLKNVLNPWQIKVLSTWPPFPRAPTQSSSLLNPPPLQPSDIPGRRGRKEHTADGPRSTASLFRTGQGRCSRLHRHRRAQGFVTVQFLQGVVGRGVQGEEDPLGSPLPQQKALAGASTCFFPSKGPGLYTCGGDRTQRISKLNTAQGGESPWWGGGWGGQGCVQALSTKREKKLRKQAKLERKNRIQPLSLSVLCNLKKPTK